MRPRNYINRADKDMVLTMLAAATAMELADQNPLFLESRKKVRTVRTLLYQIAEAAMDHIDHEQLGQMLRLAGSGNMSIEVLYKVVPTEYVRVPRDAVERITRNALSECALCDPDKTTARKCQTRKDLLAMGVDPRSEGVCPYAIL